ncbi:MAG TPA: BON domain-containing protein [Armatimonadota bacterium]|nr:BON domain-containing protein [Armatimonadota bacterium]
MKKLLGVAALATGLALTGCTQQNGVDQRVQGVRQELNQAAQNAQQAAANAALAAKVKTALDSRKGLDASKINVDAKSGTVLLKGDVNSRAEAEVAERVALETEGVNSVENQLAVRVPAKSLPPTTAPAGAAPSGTAPATAPATAPPAPGTY